MPIESFDNVCVSRLIGRYEIDPKSKKFQGRETNIGVAMPVERDSGADIQKLKNKIGGKRTPQVNKFVVTKEHRKDLKKLVKDMKASFEKDPKSLRGLDLSGIDFRSLEKLELIGLDLSEVNFSKCKFPVETDFKSSELKNANFIKADLSYASFDDVEAEGAKFIDATLVGVRIRDSNFIEANFSSANLSDARITFTDFDYSILNKANLCDAYFGEVGFHKATATHASVGGYTHFMYCSGLPEDLRL
ncbi:MAG: pentapeptide repeat-containing protein [Roseibium album]|uniref:pentapeptide repeat-containing protein n=1 Tax=Roseibium album TaxID=311410 RepID=UPI0032ED0429